MKYIDFLTFRLETAIIIHGKTLKHFARDHNFDEDKLKSLLYLYQPKHRLSWLAEIEAFLNDFERDYYLLYKHGLLQVPDVYKQEAGGANEVSGKNKRRLNREKVHKDNEGDDEDKRIQKKYKIKRRKKYHKRIKRYDFRRSYKEIRDNIDNNPDSDRDFLSCYCRMDSEADTPAGKQGADTDGEGD